MKILLIFVVLFVNLTSTKALGDVSIKNTLKDYGVETGTYYSSTYIDVDNDGDKDALIYLTGQWCGSGGCTLLILENNLGEFSVNSKIPTVRTPFFKLAEPDSSNRNVFVGVRSGGGAEKRFVRLKYSNETTSYGKSGFIEDVETNGLVVVMQERPDYTIM